MASRDHAFNQIARQMATEKLPPIRFGFCLTISSANCRESMAVSSDSITSALGTLPVSAAAAVRAQLAQCACSLGWKCERPSNSEVEPYYLDAFSVELC